MFACRWGEAAGACKLAITQAGTEGGRTTRCLPEMRKRLAGPSALPPGRSAHLPACMCMHTPRPPSPANVGSSSARCTPRGPMGGLLNWPDARLIASTSRTAGCPPNPASLLRPAGRHSGRGHVMDGGWPGYVACTTATAQVHPRQAHRQHPDNTKQCARCRPKLHSLPGCGMLACTRRTHLRSAAAQCPVPALACAAALHPSGS